MTSINQTLLAGGGGTRLAVLGVRGVGSERDYTIVVRDSIK